jgi:hypothetical protein
MALSSLAACSRQQASEHELMMQSIEPAVEVPPGAKTLGEYSRNSALRPDGTVMAVYVIPRPAEAHDSDYGCDVALGDLGVRPCTDAEEAEIAVGENAAAERSGQPNQSRWLDNYGDLPMILDVFCNLIEIIFDPQSQRIEITQCNGKV